MKNDTLPEIQFLLGYYYLARDKEKGLKYIKLSIDGGYKAAYNLMGCYDDGKEGHNRIEYFTKALEAEYPRAYSNLANEYVTLKNDDEAKKYLQMGIDQGILCCETTMLNYYDKNNMDKCKILAEKGCLLALRMLYRNAGTDNEKYKLDKLGDKFERYTFFRRLMLKYKSDNRYKFLALLEKHRKSTNYQILYDIGKEYAILQNNDKVHEYYVRALKYGGADIYKLVSTNELVIFTSPKFSEKLTQVFELANVDEKDDEKTNISKLNLITQTVIAEKLQDAKIMCNQFNDDYFKYVGLSVYYSAKGKKQKTYDLLKKAFDIDPKKLDLYERLGIYSEDLGRHDDAEGYYYQGIIEMDCDLCRIRLGTIALNNKKYLVAAEFLVSSRSAFHNNRWQDLHEEIMRKCSENNVGKYLIDNVISGGINILLKSNCDNLSQLCGPYIFKNMECPICYCDNDHLKMLCGHAVCIHCIKDIKQNKCPFCKTKIVGFIIAKGWGERI
jgi:tetratricopeptide (TPR) repeat protein